MTAWLRRQLRLVEGDRRADLGRRGREHVGGGAAGRPHRGGLGAEPIAERQRLRSSAAQVAATVGKVAAPHGVDQSLRSSSGPGGAHEARSIARQRNEQGGLRKPDTTPSGCPSAIWG
jgi:hypothetical protein